MVNVSFLDGIWNKGFSFDKLCLRIVIIKKKMSCLILVFCFINFYGCILISLVLNLTTYINKLITTRTNKQASNKT